MDKIRFVLLNKDAVDRTRTMMAFAARLTQRGNELTDVKSVMDLYNKPASDDFVLSLVDLPHPTLQKFETLDIVIVGASSRFLRQITRHQNEVKFMSGSLQYSDYSDNEEDSFMVPYEVLEKDCAPDYLWRCTMEMRNYEKYAEEFGRDVAGYLAPQGLRNVLLISATPYQWKHMIGQRICRRNTTETRYVMLKIWEMLYQLDPIVFGTTVTGAGCQRDRFCQEGKMSCKNPIGNKTPAEILRKDFPLIYNGTEDN